jgi:hypothetical protein
MTDLIARIREVIDEHAKRSSQDDIRQSCGCGATELSDHSAHLAEAIAHRLGLRADAVKAKVRYASALVDEELTVLEGAE